MRRRRMHGLLVGAVALLWSLALTPVSNATTAAVPPPAGTNTQAGEIAACAALYSVPATPSPDPLGPCQWDMRAINATSAGSYAVNQGAGARVGDMDTGIDLTHPDIMPNLDVAASCSFIYATRRRRSQRSK